jgi:hypothetical protein
MNGVRTHNFSAYIVRLGDICNALRYSNQYFLFILEAVVVVIVR